MTAQPKLGPQEPPDDPHIFNRRQPDGTFRPISEFFEPEKQRDTMTQHTPTPWKLVNLNDCPGLIDIEGADGIVVNTTPHEADDPNPMRIVACVNFCGEVLTDALEESNLEGMYTRGAGDDLKAMAVKFRDQRDVLRQDKADLVEAAEAAIRYDESIAGRATRGEYDLSGSGYGVAEGEDLDALYLDWITKAKAAIAKAGKES